jgi:uncharacterized protein YbbK (DUF523 family)
VIRIAVSSCLLGAPVRFDGRDKFSSHPTLQRWAAEGRLITICPELLGGMGVPRPPAEIVMRDGERRVITNEGSDVTEAFENGARTAEAEAMSANVRLAILKEGSPSCGTSYVYDGTFTKTRVDGAQGVAAARLRERGIAVFSEEEIDAAEAYLRGLES